MGEGIMTQECRRAGSYIDEIAGMQRVEAWYKELSKRQVFNPPPSNCPANSAHHWIIEGRNMTCKHCGGVKAVNLTRFSQYGRGHLHFKGAKC